MKKAVSQESEMYPHVEAQQASGQTQQSYCDQHQITPHVLSYWIKRYRLKKESGNEQGFVCLSPPRDIISSVAMELVGSNGIRLMFYSQPDPSFIKSLLS
jgi:adenylate kinase family enzyme